MNNMKIVEMAGWVYKTLKFKPIRGDYTDKSAKTKGLCPLSAVFLFKIIHEFNDEDFKDFEDLFVNIGGYFSQDYVDKFIEVIDCDEVELEDFKKTEKRYSKNTKKEEIIAIRDALDCRNTFFGKQKGVKNVSK